MDTENRTSSALGKGLDALISNKFIPKDNVEINVDSETVIDAELEEKLEVEKTLDLNEKLVDEILAEIKKNPRISLWSAKSAAVLRYLRKTQPEFSISNEASLLIEEAIKEKYPQIWELFEEHL